jgi:hypothetical protein
MKNIIFYSLLVALFIPLQSQAFGIKKWQEPNGDTIYGDNPPQGQTSQAVNLPPITIIEALPVDNQHIYQNQSNDLTATSSSNNQANNYSTSANNNAYRSKENERDNDDEAIKRDLQLMTPKHDQAIRANNGEVTITFKARPALQKGERLVLYLDDRQKMAGEQTHFTLEQLDRGTHTVFGVWQDRKGNTLAKSKSVTFHVLRFSILHPRNQQDLIERE